MNDSHHTVCVIDDDPSVRKALSRLIRAEGFTVAVYGSTREFLEECDEAAPGCLVLDVRMPELNGLEFQDMLSASGNDVPIVFLTGHGDVPSSVRAMKHGAVDFLTKPVDRRELLQAVRAAVEEGRVRRLTRSEVSEIKARVESLTPRERQVLAHVISGEPNKRIAAELGTVEKTIKVHRARVMRKMKARSVAELVRLSERAGVIPSSRIL